MQLKLIKNFLVFLFLFLGSTTIFSQVKNNFEVRYEADIRGELTFIANNIVNRQANGFWSGPWWNRTWNPAATPNDPYNLTGWSSSYNDNLNMQYIDIDGDASTFSSSSATLNIPNETCAKIRYAGLYWSAVYVNPNRSTLDHIKFQVPGGTYQDLAADEILFDGNGDVDFGYYSPYACYKDVTSIVSALANPNGDYFVANVRASTGGGISGGISGGWTMVIVYEDPTLPGSKFITTFDGYAGIASAAPNVLIPINGFTTLPAPFNVRANIGVASLEGDNRINGDGLEINANGTFFPISNTINPRTPNVNFFNSTISIDDVMLTARNPNRTNTLGWDVDLIDLQNNFNNIIPNDATSAVLRLSSTQDKYDIFFASFDVEIIEPNIVLEKRVQDIGGNDITGLGVDLGQTLDYVLSFQNIGNDDATDYTIRDILPINTSPPDGRANFIPSDFVLPPGMAQPAYDPATKTLIFTVPDNLVNDDDPVYSIRMRVQVAENCFDFVDACSDLIQNLAYSTYRGVENSALITDDPSVSDFDSCGFIVPGATNFLLDDLTDCNFTRTVELCGANVILNAGDNFDDYIWVRDDNGNNQIDPTDTVLNDGDPDNDPSTLIVSTVGTYIVDKIVADPCKGFKEIISVVPYGSGTITNPIIDYFNAVNSDADPSNDLAGEIVQCSIDNALLPKLFLCGSNDTRLLQVNILDAQNIVWEKLDETSCTAAGDDCANKNLSCTWNSEGTGNNYTLTSAGKYRLSVTYQNGCSNRFYFSVFQNTLDLLFKKSDIICTTPGNITITNLGNGYGYQLIDATTNAVLIPFSANNGPSFDFGPGQNGGYRVEVSLLDASGDPILGACIFSTPDIGILEKDFQVAVVTTPASCIALGSINFQVSNVDPNYEYEIRLDDGSNGGLGTLLDNETAQPDNNYTFSNLNPGNYIAIARTDDGCSYSEQVTIIDNDDLDLNAQISQQITCGNGIVLMEATGGKTPSYSYAIWSFVDDGGTTVISYPTVLNIPASAYQSNPDFTILTPGDYTFVVVDDNNCFVFSNTVTLVDLELEYNTSLTNESCFGINDGTFTVNVTNSNGYSVAYFLTYPDTSTNSNTSGSFTSLPQGDFILDIQLTSGTVSCTIQETFTIAGPIDTVTGIAVITQDYTCLQDGIIEAQNVTGGTAPYEYSINGINFFSGPGAETFSNLTNGSYTITIRDANLCTFTTSAVILDPLNEPSDLTFTSTAPNCPTLTSDVTVTVVDGNTPFVFTIIAPAAITATSTSGSSADFNGLAPNTYTFRVTDDKGCFYDESFTITAVVPINVVGQLVNNITCFSDTDGNALFTVSGFNTSYDYSVTGPSTFSGTGETNTTIPLAGLDDGAYTITVTDTDTNCTDTATVTIAAPAAALTLSAAETQPTCTTDGSVALTTTGGWGSNSFSLTNPDTTLFGTNTTGSFTNLLQTGVYTVSVTDTNNCIVTTTFILGPAVAPVLQIVPNDVCYDGGVGLTLTANVISGGDGNYQYSLNGGIFGTSNVFTGLAPGTHTIIVRDGKNCTDTDSITINPELTLTAVAANINACGTTTDITITAAGGDGTFVYAVVADGAVPAPGDFGASNSITVTGTGDYDVYVRDNNGVVSFCMANYDITIAQDAAVAISISNTAILCSGESTSTITITASGGEGPYEYSIDNGTTYQASNTFVNQAAGGYNVRIKDANNCEASDTHSISEPFTLSASAAVADLAECNPTLGAEVRITNAQGGTLPYQYSFDGGATYSTNPIGNLLPGNHTLFLRDTNNCLYPMNITINPEPNAPNVLPAITYECDGEGTIVLTPDNPAYNYTYGLDGTPNTPDTSNSFSNVAIGSHTVTISYTNSTPPTPSILLTEDFGTGPNISISEIDASEYCYESQDASAETCSDTNTRINDKEYSVTQSINAPFGSWQNPNDASLTPNGRFLVINIGNPNALGTNTIIYAKRNIEVIPNREVQVSIALFNLLKQGTSGLDPDVLIELVDASNNVIASTTTGLIPKNTGANDWFYPLIPSLNPGANTNIDIVIRTIASGTNGNDIAIDDIIAQQIPEVCPQSIDIPIVIEDGHAFEATTINTTNTTCNGDLDGTFTFEIENFDTINGFEYNVDGGAFSVPQTSSPITVNGLGAGIHSIVIRDVLNNTCSTTLSETITEPTAVVASASITNVMTCTVGATITASATGGTPAYEYQLEDTLGNPIATYDFASNTTNTIFTGLADGDYIIRVRDTKLCADTTTITVIAPQAVAFTPTPTACYSGNSDGTIQINVTSGNGGYQFSLNGGPWITPSPLNATTHTFSSLVAGTYTIDVKDQSGCPLPLATYTQTVTIEDQLLATVVVTDISSCTNGSITVTASGGDGSYQYAYVPTTTDPTALFVASNTFTVTTGNDGVYDVYVRDNSATVPFCEFVETVTINPAVSLVYTALPTDPECHDGLGSIAINITSGKNPYEIEIIDLDNGGASNQTNTNVFATTHTYYNLLPGNYTINITDSFGCLIATTPVAINNPDDITANITPILPAACNSAILSDYGFKFTLLTAPTGLVEYSHDGGLTWQISDELRGHASGTEVYPSIRVTRPSGNICQIDFPRYTIPYPLDDLDITLSAIIIGCNILRVDVEGSEGDSSSGYQYTYTDDPSNFDPATAIWTASVPLGTKHIFQNIDSVTPQSPGLVLLVPGKTYVFYVRDTAGCVRQSNVNVNSLVLLPIEISSAYEPSCFGANDAEIVFTLNPITAYPQMRWELFELGNSTPLHVSGGGAVAANVAYSNTITISGLAQEEYYISVFQVDGGGVDACIGGSENILIEELDAISATLSSPRNISCTVAGLILIDNITGGSGTYTYTVTGPAGFVTITGTTDNPVEIISGSPAGTYTVLVEDLFGCSFTNTVDVDLDPTPEISLDVVNNCPDEGEFQLTVTLDVAGMLPYSLSINGGAFENVVFNGSNEYTITDLSSGAAQTITIRDLNGCGETENFTIQPPLQFNATLTTLLDCEVAPANNAEITIDVSTGSGNYDYEITGPINQVRAAMPTNPFVWTLAGTAGSYTVTVYDTSTNIPNCLGAIVVDVPIAITPIFTHIFTDISCNSADDGTIALFQTDNGINPLTYSISPVAGTFNATTNTFENLPPNTYTVTATGTNDCTSTITNIVIREPFAIANVNASVIEFGCTAGNNSDNATISIDDTLITGGAGVYLAGTSGTYVIYEFINDQGTVGTGDDVIVQSGTNTTYVETNTTGGTYIINVYDNAGCTGTTTTTILPFDELLTSTASITNNLSCNPGTDGEITINVTSTGFDTTDAILPDPFEYSDDNGITYQASNVFAGLTSGTHNFLIRHTATGCILTASETITDPNTFSIDVVKLQDVICFGTETAEVTLELVDATYAGAITWNIYDTNGTISTADDILYKNGTFISTGPTTPITLIVGDYVVEVIQNGFPQCTNLEAFTIAGPSEAITGNTDVTDITCLGNDGIIEIIDLLGGWGGYSYYVGTIAPTASGDYTASARFDALAPNTYEAWVIDSNGCQQMVQNTIILTDPALINATIQVNQENCTNLQGEIEVVGTVGGQGSNYTYQLIKDGVAVGSPQTTTIFSGLGAGTYTVQITDQWSCSFTTAATVLYEEMNVTSTVVKSIDCTAVPGGEISIGVNGGSANLQFIVTFPDLSTTITNITGVFTGLTQVGLYTFAINDLDTNNPVCAKTITKELDAPTPVTLDTPTLVDVSCNGLNDASIRVHLMPIAPGVNDNPLYTYNLYDATGITLLISQASPIFTGLSGSTGLGTDYVVEVVSSRGCDTRVTYQITEPSILTATATATAFVCDPSNTASTSTITAIAGGGTGSYLYSIDNVNFQTSNTFETIDTGSVQNITIYVTDQNSCAITAVVAPIQALNVFTATVTQTTAISCIAPEQIVLTVTDNGNVANTYTYALLPIGNPNGNQTGTPTNITATYDLTAVGNYTFRITDNTTGCYIDTAAYGIAPYDLIEVTATAVNPLTCFNDTNGSLRINVTGYVGGYDYEVFTQAGASMLTGSGNTTTNPLIIPGLSGGNFYVTVTETDPASTRCDATSNIITIISPDLLLAVIISPLANVTCTNDQGEILVDPSGGYAPYDIVLTNTTTTQVYNANKVLSFNFTGLAAGNYTIVATDDGGCIFNGNETLIAATQIVANAIPLTTTLACFGDTSATVTTIVTGGGSGTYQYQLNYYDAAGTGIDFTSGPQSDVNFTNLGAGIYSITVSDGWNCDVETNKVVITEPTAVSASLIRTDPLTCATGVEFELTASGGSGSYDYSLDNITFLPMTSNPMGLPATGTLGAGTYQYYVRDAVNLCEAVVSNSITEDSIDPLVLSVDKTAALINCTGENTAIIYAEANGGLGNYQYELYRNSVLPINRIVGPQSLGEFRSLVAGTYYVTVSSEDCTTAPEEIIITDPVPLSYTDDIVNVSCFGGTNGSITVTLSGGTGDYQYAISPNLNKFDTINTFTDLAPGNYTIIAQDQNGCFEQLEYTINEPAIINVVPTGTPEICEGNEDGTIALVITGGTAPYRTSINSNADADFILGRTDFSNLAGGNYLIFIRDAQDCETNLTVSLEGGVNLNALVEPIYECSGDLPANYVNITLEDSSVIGDVLYALDSTDPSKMQLNPDFRDLDPGNHYIAIAHLNGCVKTFDFEIEAFEPLTLTLEQHNINEITAVTNGGKQDYTFYFDGQDNGASNIYPIHRTDTYEVRVVDQNGCEATASIFMEFIDIEIPNFFTPDGDNRNDYWAPKNQEGFPKILTIVFDRYGRDVYKMGINDRGWDGIYKGTALPSGDYWYVIKLKGENDDREFVGHFTLYR